jgi:phosphoribosylamine-glycine ligase
MLFGVGSATQGILHGLKVAGAEVSTYLTRDYAHLGPSLEGETFLYENYPNPCKLLVEKQIDFVIPMSIDWFLADWTEEFLSTRMPILSPAGEGMLLERDRDFARVLCEKYGIPFPKSFVARNRLEAETILKNHPLPYVIKNPLCSPSSPVHTIVCETVEDTRSWIKRVNYEEGIFLQEYMGRREAGHIALVSGGEIYSIISNQEYKRAFDGNMGIVAGAPLGGLVEKDPGDKYGLAKQCLHPLLPWFREVGFHGPVQVTAIWRDDRWAVLEYNVRLGITCGPVITKILQDPVGVLSDVANNRKPEISLRDELNFGCSLTLAGYGYPYTQVSGPRFPVTLDGEFTCDVWWNETAADAKGSLFATGHRIVDIVAVRSTLKDAIEAAYENIRKIRCLSSYYRTDIGKSLWPPGSE